ncbi:uncharacterized protein LOC133645687 isoform X5 [Entelurus aequoreus]|uniref:uncharacterized protein LOC133645687 isoform X5 n=1 Tax=Entelurus aequoreus TaxID=161455 RepID=UPI002B1E605B|nr:uncharacterized protein LOC133645687 isoform X5 [Entelurus aequoreus]
MNQCSLTHLHPLCPLSPPCLKPQLIYLQLPPQCPLHTMDHHQLCQLTQLSGLLSSQIQTGLSSTSRLRCEPSRTRPRARCADRAHAPTQLETILYQHTWD